MVFKRIKLGVIFQLPMEIIEAILLRLPVKTLVKLTAVCKSWNSLIKTSAFIHAHLSRNQNQILLIQATVGLERRGKIKGRDLYSLHWDDPPFNVYSNYKLMNNPFVVYNRSNAISPKDKINLDLERGRVDVMGACNGLVCLVAAGDYTPLIWNPCIRRFVMLPKLSPWTIRSEICSYGFGYDLCTNDYKVLRIAKYSTEGWKTSCEIWSLAQPSWKSLAAVLPVDNFWPHWKAVFVRGAVHWLHTCNVTGKVRSIVMFDMSSELFGEIMIPQVLGEDATISRYNNSLAIFESHGVIQEKQLDMWVMKEYGVADSWVKLITIQLPAEYLEPRGFRNNGEAVINYRNIYTDKPVQKILNPKINDIGDFEAKGCWFGEYKFVEPFVESLVLLDQPNAISGWKLKSDKTHQI
ncbi:hypothetical protein M0R45_028063 [Rubus argutus]|uniref:F-box domain-containing protein n=1 Tax=Rubus argutus TaxID=59490 RepID=A0AAW1W3K9_RUBAR